MRKLGISDSMTPRQRGLIRLITATVLGACALLGSNATAECRKVP